MVLMPKMFPMRSKIFAEMFTKECYLKEVFKCSMVNYLPQHVKLLIILQVMQNKLNYISNYMAEV